MSVHRLCVTDDRLTGRRIVVVADSEETDRRRPSRDGSPAPSLPPIRRAPRTASPVARALHPACAPRGTAHRRVVVFL